MRTTTSHHLSRSRASIALAGRLAAAATVVAATVVAVVGGERAPVDAAFSGQNGLIAFGSDRSGGGDVYAMRADGSGVVRLTAHPSFDGEPAYSATGQVIAFESTRTGNLDLHLMDADGANVRRLTDHPAADSAPSFSPDGRSVAFVSTRSGNPDIWVLDVASGNVRQITDDPADDTAPAFAPDGRRIAFVSDRRGNDDLWVTSADGRTTVQLTNDLRRDAGPSWSPDGSTIAFVSDRTNDSEIHLVRSDGATMPTRLFEFRGADLAPAFSPDGGELTFVHVAPGGTADVYRADVRQNATPVQLTGAGSSDLAPDWQPAARASTTTTQAPTTSTTRPSTTTTAGSGATTTTAGGATTTTAAGGSTTSTTRQFLSRSQGEVDDPTPAAGQVVTISGRNFEGDRNLEVTFQSTPYALGSIRSAPDGSYRAQVRIPHDATPGGHRITVAGPGETTTRHESLIDVNVDGNGRAGAASSGGGSAASGGSGGGSSGGSTSGAPAPVVVADVASSGQTLPVTGWPLRRVLPVAAAVLWGGVTLVLTAGSRRTPAALPIA